MLNMPVGCDQAFLHCLQNCHVNRPEAASLAVGGYLPCPQRLHVSPIIEFRRRKFSWLLGPVKTELFPCE
jgi:hypothetical protein